MFDTKTLTKLKSIDVGDARPDGILFDAFNQRVYVMSHPTKNATVIDTPPANTSSDASRICSVVTYCLLVARRNRSFVSDVRQLAEQLKADRAQVVGTVLCQD